MSVGITMLFLCFSCSNPTESSQKPVYYDWKTFLRKEINRLQNLKPTVHKSIILDGQKESKTLSEINFENELALFLDADLNKSAYENSYENLSENNLIWYSLKKDENLKVKKVLIHLDLMELPENVEIEVQEKNILFSTEKKLHMHFIEGKLETYSIDGSQQLAWLTPTHYKMMGVILSK
jgi:hypothetical protein